MAIVHIQAGHVQPIWAGHPWVFRGGINRTEGIAAPGDAVDVLDPSGKFLGRGFFSPGAIAVRILTRDEKDALDAEFLSRRIRAAVEMRRSLLKLPSSETTGLRLVNSEGDDLGGLTVDAFGDVLAVQFLTVGMKQREDDIFAVLQSCYASRAIYEVGRARHQEEEGIACETHIARGQAPPGTSFLENGLTFEADICMGQKTGFYFDQRENRAAIARYCEGRTVLDLFSYSGAFAAYALKGGAVSALCVDSSARALVEAERIARLNTLEKNLLVVNANVAAFLQEAVAKGSRYGVVIVDPPNFAHAARDRDAARKAYRKLNAMAMRTAADGGVLATACCSGQIPMEDFLRAVGIASAEAGVRMRVVDVRGAAGDHPYSPAFEQGRYLKFVIAEIRGGA